MRLNCGCNSGSPPVKLTVTLPSPNRASASSTTASMRSGSSECTLVTSSRMQWGQRRLQCCVSAKPSSMLEHRAPAPSRACPAADRGAGLQREVGEWGQLHHLRLHPGAFGASGGLRLVVAAALIWHDIVLRLAHGSSVGNLRRRSLATHHRTSNGPGSPDGKVAVLQSRRIAAARRASHVGSRDPKSHATSLVCHRDVACDLGSRHPTSEPRRAAELLSHFPTAK